jgi:RNA methyltransferase, TrmH family
METLSKNRLKELSKLKQKKYREAEGYTITEGYRLLKHLSDNYVFPEELYISEAESTKYDLKANKTFEVTRAQLEKLTDTKNPQNIAALLKTDPKKITNIRFLLYLDNIKEPGNLGTIFRTASAAEVSGIVLSPECCEAFNPKTIRASLGTVFTMPFEVRPYEWLKGRKSTVISTSLKDAENLFTVEIPKENIVLVVGSEAFGVSENIFRWSDMKVKIPVSEKTESLNVSVATGICIYHLLNLQKKNSATK